MRLLAAGLLLVARLCAAFYLPGLAPVSFCEKGEESEGCKVSALTGGPDAGFSAPAAETCLARGFRGEGGPPSIPAPLRAGLGRSPSGGTLFSVKPATPSSLSLVPPAVFLP